MNVSNVLSKLSCASWPCSTACADSTAGDCTIPLREASSPHCKDTISTDQILSVCTLALSLRQLFIAIVIFIQMDFHNVNQQCKRKQAV